MMTRMSLLSLASLAVVTLLGCSAGGSISMFDDDRRARVVRYEERHCYGDECDVYYRGKVISTSLDVDVGNDDD